RLSNTVSATFTGTVNFAAGPGATAIVGNTAFDKRGQYGVRTTNASPNDIPTTPIVPNRPQVITGFSGQLEPTATPTFSSHGSLLLGSNPTDPTPTPPAAPAAGGTESRQSLGL